ncbi:DUF1080 domain-containing protein [Ravibacter arvi]
MKNITTRLSLLTLFIAGLLSFSFAAAPKPPIEGRWDITVDVKGTPLPSWLEVRHSGYNTLVGQFVGTSGSARPVSQIHFKDGSFNFSIPTQWEKGNSEIKVSGKVNGDKISGTLVSAEGETFQWTGQRAPKLRKSGEPNWGQPIPLIKANSFAGWKALGKNNNWVVKDGVLSNPKSGANIATEATFEDFKLHVEFRIPKGSNSGVYLRGRYEIQVTDSHGMEPEYDQLGAIYGFLTPITLPAKPAGEWQSLDITLVGRLVTVALNGVTIIHPQEIPGVTGGALDSNEGAPGPLMIQGDHGAVDYRNITITPAR